MRISRNVPAYLFGEGALAELPRLIGERRTREQPYAAYLVDAFFADGRLEPRLGLETADFLHYVSTEEEPTTTAVDALTARVRHHAPGQPCAIIGIGGGSTLDTCKAVSILLTNDGAAEDYQGWDLVKRPGVFKIGVPTLSGTGAEASRTCVITHPQKNLKLGMNSEFSVMDLLVLDPRLSATVPRDQYFYTAMDTYIHCVESLSGRHRHAMSDAFSQEAQTLCREVFLSSDMQTAENREKVMVASYLGGASIANTFVGVVHPLSAGLSTVLHVHHCVANCIVMNVMEEFYPEQTLAFRRFVAAQRVTIPTGVCSDLSATQREALYKSAIVHEKPLANALGPEFRSILTPTRVRALYDRM